MFFFSGQDLSDVDTGIRFLQYAGLAWSVVDLVPSLLLPEVVMLVLGTTRLACFSAT